MGMPAACRGLRQGPSAVRRAAFLQLPRPAQAAPTAPSAPTAPTAQQRPLSLSLPWRSPSALQSLLLLLVLLPLLPTSHSSTSSLPRAHRTTLQPHRTTPQPHRTTLQSSSHTRRIAEIVPSPTLSHDSILPHSAGPLPTSPLSPPQGNNATAATQPGAQPALHATGATDIPKGAGVPRYSPSSLLKYYKGPLLTRPSPVHFVWYGNWRGGAQGRADKGQSVLRKFVASISAKGPTGPGTVRNWWKINSLLAQKDRQLVTEKVYLASEHYDWYSRGRALSDDNSQNDDLFLILKRLMDKGQLAADPRAMYVVMTSPDVQVGSSYDGFCSLYCGFHDVAQYYSPRTKRRTSIFYAFVGSPGRQCSGCGMLRPTPNGLPGIDFMVTTLAHELAEIATDPDTRTGWLTDSSSTGQENADLCIGVYLRLRAATQNRVKFQYNLQGVSGYKFMVQSNYNPVKAACTMAP